jgi:hypothetical protein
VTVQSNSSPTNSAGNSSSNSSADNNNPLYAAISNSEATQYAGIDMNGAFINLQAVALGANFAQAYANTINLELNLKTHVLSVYLNSSNAQDSGDPINVSVTNSAGNVCFNGVVGHSGSDTYVSANATLNTYSAAGSNWLSPATYTIKCSLGNSGQILKTGAFKVYERGFTS